MSAHNTYNKMSDKNSDLPANGSVMAGGEGILFGIGNNAYFTAATSGYIKGAMFSETENGVVYVNKGTLATSSWKAITTAA